MGCRRFEQPATYCLTSWLLSKTYPELRRRAIGPIGSWAVDLSILLSQTGFVCQQLRGWKPVTPLSCTSCVLTSVD